MVPEPVMWVLAFAAGGLLGVVFFGGLLWTVRRGTTSSQPGLWFSVSLLVRTAIVLAGFYAVSTDHWQRMLLCLVGFTIARPVVERVTRTSTRGASAPAKEAPHAPQP